MGSRTGIGAALRYFRSRTRQLGHFLFIGRRNERRQHQAPSRHSSTTLKAILKLLHCFDSIHSSIHQMPNYYFFAEYTRSSRAIRSRCEEYRSIDGHDSFQICSERDSDPKGGGYP